MSTTTRRGPSARRTSERATLPTDCLGAHEFERPLFERFVQSMKTRSKSQCDNIAAMSDRNFKQAS